MTMTEAWLVRTTNGVRVKWRNEDGVLQDADFATEAQARAFGGNLLEFRPDLETAFVRAGELRRSHPELSPEEAMERAGISTTRRAP
jgi:hypothetical protein